MMLSQSFYFKTFTNTFLCVQSASVISSIFGGCNNLLFQILMLHRIFPNHPRNRINTATFSQQQNKFIISWLENLYILAN